jgi:hypothetical protein
MGNLLYGTNNSEITFEDRALAHLQIVIIAKLRRQESLAFSWVNAPSAGSGRSTIWLAPSSDLQFRFAGSRPPAINREWIEALMLSANSANGLFFSPEPGAASAVSTATRQTLGMTTAG